MIFVFNVKLNGRFCPKKLKLPLIKNDIESVTKKGR